MHTIQPTVAGVKTAQQLALFPISATCVTPLKASHHRSTTVLNVNSPRHSFKGVTLPPQRLFHEWDRVRSSLRQLFPKRTSWLWVDQALELLRLWSVYRRAFPTGRFVVRKVAPKQIAMAGFDGPVWRDAPGLGRGENVQRSVAWRTFWRLVKWLEAQGLLRRQHRYHADGRWGANEYDLRGLEALLVRLLNALVKQKWCTVERVGGALWVKLGAFWTEMWLLGPVCAVGHERI